MVARECVQVAATASQNKVSLGFGKQMHYWDVMKSGVYTKSWILQIVGQRVMSLSMLHYSKLPHLPTRLPAEGSAGKQDGIGFPCNVALSTYDADMNHDLVK